METRPLIGKTIKKIHQHSYIAPGGGRDFGIESIEFTDGSRLMLTGMERDDAVEYEVHGTYVRAGRLTNEETYQATGRSGA